MLAIPILESKQSDLYLVIQMTFKIECMKKLMEFTLHRNKTYKQRQIKYQVIDP